MAWQTQETQAPNNHFPNNHPPPSPPFFNCHFMDLATHQHPPPFFGLVPQVSQQVEQDLQRFSICCQDHQFSSTSIQCFGRLIRTFLQLLIVRCLLPWHRIPTTGADDRRGCYEKPWAAGFFWEEHGWSTKKWVKWYKLLPCVGISTCFLALGSL